MQQLYDQNPGMQERMEADRKARVKQFLNKKKSEQLVAIGTIPVHVIICHPPGQSEGSGSNLSMDHILSQIEVLNEDFTATNSDYGNTPGVFDVGNPDIEFCLASQDPDGNATDGVTRYPTNQNLGNNENAIKQETSWDPDSYLNIWVSPNIGGLLGWAYFPGVSPQYLDGLVITTSAFGGAGYATSNNYGLGRTATHELGHYFDLAHTFAGSCGSSDGFPDTPPQQASNYGCPNHPSTSCGNSGDFFMNYMDYVNDDCMVTFSDDQSNHMQGILTGVRSSLLSSSGCDGGSIPDPLELFLLESSDPDCYDGENGEIFVEAIGGDDNYTYFIDGTNSNFFGEFENLEPGNYTISVEDGIGGYAEVNVDIFNPNELLFSFTETSDVTCNGYNDGSITTEVQGGTGFVYFSLNGNTYNNSYLILDDLEPNTYELFAIDENNCTISTVFTIEEPEEIGLYVETIVDELDCFSDNIGMVALAVTDNSGGSYTYSSDGISFTENNIFSELEPGEYNFTVMDDNECTETITVAITGPEELTLEISELADITCNGSNNGSLNLIADGGTNDYTYYLDDLTNPISPELSDLGPGTYTFIVQDDNDCTTTTEIMLTEPEPIMVSVDNIVEVECFGEETGEASVTGSGGIGDLSYTIDMTSNITGSFSGLTSGSYTVIVSDDNECTEEVVFEIGQTSNLDIVVSNINHVRCADEADGSFSIEGAGGTGNYTYSSDGISFDDVSNFENLAGGNYDVFVKDDNDCITIATVEIVEPEALAITPLIVSEIDCYDSTDGIINLNVEGGTGSYTYSNQFTTQENSVFENLGEEDYIFTVTDELGCSAMIEISLEQPEEIITSITNQENNSCEGSSVGYIDLDASGGSGTITYALGNIENQTGIFENLPSGSYEITMTDENDCTSSIALEIKNDVNITTQVIESIPPTCNGDSDGSVAVSADGGSGNYTYTLGTESNQTGVFSNLPSGSYDIIVNDPTGCTAELSAEVSEAVIIDLEDIFVTDVSCNGTATGSIVIDATGGSGMINFTLSGTTNTTGIFENLVATSYELEIVDDNNCGASTTITIEEPEEISINITAPSAISCFGDSDGSLQISADGGTGDYSFNIDGENNTNGSYDNLNAGTYDILVTDDNNCQQMISTIITEPEEMTVEIDEQENVSCFGEANGSIKLITTGGTPGYSYELAGQSTPAPAFINLAAQEYTTIIRDANDCTTSFDFEITEPESLTVTTALTHETGNADGIIDIVVSGGTEPYEISSDAGPIGADNAINNLSEGNYSIEAIDANGCVVVHRVEIVLKNVYDGIPDGTILNESLYPVPALTDLTFDFETPDDHIMVYTFYDDTGRLIGTIENFATAGFNTITFDVSHLTASTYLLRAVSSRDRKELPFIVVK